jgi:hypothetical protein
MPHLTERRAGEHTPSAEGCVQDVGWRLGRLTPACRETHIFSSKRLECSAKYDPQRVGTAVAVW